MTMIEEYLQLTSSIYDAESSLVILFKNPRKIYLHDTCAPLKLAVVGIQYYLTAAKKYILVPLPETSPVTLHFECSGFWFKYYKFLTVLAHCFLFLAAKESQKQKTEELSKEDKHIPHIYAIL